MFCVVLFCGTSETFDHAIVRPKSPRKCGVQGILFDSFLGGSPWGQWSWLILRTRVSKIKADPLTCSGNLHDPCTNLPLQGSPSPALTNHFTQSSSLTPTSVPLVVCLPSSCLASLSVWISSSFETKRRDAFNLKFSPGPQSADVSSTSETFWSI